MSVGRNKREKQSKRKRTAFLDEVNPVGSLDGRKSVGDGAL
jgi:hypothetical protein